MKRVTDIIRIENMMNWKGGDVITISAGTGTGKSFFIKNKLAAFANTNDKKVLMLIHRSNTVDQFRAEIKSEGKEHIIDVKTYQSIEAKLKRGANVDFSKYAYIVCDEFHYFLSDAAFNKFTDLSLRGILGATNAVKLFMSATGEETLKYIENIEGVKVKERYSVEGNYDYINSIKFYNNHDTVKGLMQEWCRTGEKAIIFIQSAEKAYELYKEFKDFSIFNCSKSNPLFATVDEDEIDEILYRERFESQFLITTTAFDAGVNLIDLELHNIVVDVKNTSSLIQCVGRKRVQNLEDTVNLYVKNIGGSEIELIKGRLTKRKKMAQFLKNNGEDAFLNEYYREFDTSGLIYVDKDENGNNVFNVNRLMYLKTNLTMMELDLIKRFGEHGYAKYIMNKFSKKDKISYVEIEEKEATIEDYLEKLLNDEVIMFTDEEKNELINTLNIRNNGRIVKNRKTLNFHLEEEFKSPYRIEKTRKTKTIDGKRKNFSSCWYIVKIG